MAKQNNSMDGFVAKQSGERPMIGGANSGSSANAPIGGISSNVTPRTLGGSEQRPLSTPANDINDSLRDIAIDAGVDGNDPSKKPKKSRKRRIIKWIIIIVVLAILGAGGWLAYKALSAGGQVFSGNIIDFIQNKPLKQDANGRSNILILGTAQDDPNHDAGYLTDSMMVLSVDQTNKNAYMMSIPRDLEVKYGEACMSGYAGKINAYFNCVGGANNDIEADRQALTKEAGFIGEMLGMDIQYGVNINYTVMRELVGAIGGITVNIEGSGGGKNGVMDSNFDWKCGVNGDRLYRSPKEKEVCPPSGHFIDYPNGPAELDAEHALYLAQARGDKAPTYGLERSNFDREINQQKIVKAIREKAFSAGVLTDFGKVSGILDAIGNNMRTTFETSEMRTLASLAQDIKSENIQSISFVDSDPALMTGDGQPTAGKYNFADIQAYIKKKLSSNPVVREEAKILVLNGSGTKGLGQKEADKLIADGFTIQAIDNAPAGTYADVEVYQVAQDKPATGAKLVEKFKTELKTAIPFEVVDGMDYVVIFGKDTAPVAQ